MQLTARDEQILNGEYGPAPQTAMRILTQLGEVVGADEMLDVEQVHVDGCIYESEAHLGFAEKLASLGGRVILPTTLNATSLDLRHPDAWGYSALWKSKAQRMANAYVSMGCTPTWTCAPYQTESLPKFGQQIAWAESNAIVYANSVISARGSSTGSGILLEAIRLGNAPAAMILKRRDAILALGALMSRELYGKTMPLVVVSESEFAELHKARGARGTETGQVEWEFRETH